MSRASQDPQDGSGVTRTHRSNGTTEQRAERDKQRLNRGFLTYRKAIADISARLATLRYQTEHEIAQAIWDGVAVRTVASAASITAATARSFGSASDGLPRSHTTAESHIRTLRVLTQQAGRLKAEQEQLRQQQEQIVVTALETGLLDPPWVAAVSGLSLERVNMLTLRTPPHGSILNHDPDAAEVSAGGHCDTNTPGRT